MRLAVASVLLIILAIASARAQEPLSSGEVLILLEAGVGSDEVERALDLRGGPSTITEAELVDAARLGGTEPLLHRLERAADSLRRLERLARDFQVWRDPDRRIEMLVPRDWSVVAVPAEGRLFATLESPLAHGDQWFQAPRVFLAVEAGTWFPVAAEGEIAARIARLLQDRLESLGFSPREVLAGAGSVGDRAALHHEMTATVPGAGFSGMLALRTRIFPGGLVATLGFTCAREAAPGLRPVFEEIVSSLTPGATPARTVDR